MTEFKDYCCNFQLKKHIFVVRNIIIMNQVIAHIDISTATGRRLVKDLEKHKKSVKIEYPLPEAISGQRTYTLDESYNECCDILSKNYGVDVRNL